MRTPTQADETLRDALRRLYGAASAELAVRSVAEQLADLQIDGAAILDETRAFIRQFVVFPDEHCLVAVTLWAAHTHLVENFHTTPRLALLSPEPSSGKTRVLEVLHLLVPEAMFSLSASPAAVFRSLQQRQVTLLFDEVDAIWSKRGRDDNHEDLRAMLNAGYRRGATIPRCVGPKHDVCDFQVYCAVALAGLGELPDTIMSRSIIIKMRRRAPGEDVEPFRTRQHEALGHAIRKRLAIFAKAIGPSIADAWPELPSGIVDRPAECWEPLLAVADAAGGDWPDKVRAACVELCKVAQDRRVSLGIRLLQDLRIIFGDSIALHTATILARLCDGTQHGLDGDAPWAELHGRPLGVRGLASMLKKYGATSTKVKVEGLALQGYRRDDLWDAWVRYLPVSHVPAQAEPVEPMELTAVNQPVKGSVSGSGGSETRIHPEPLENLHVTDFAGAVPRVPEVPVPRTPRSALA